LRKTGGLIGAASLESRRHRGGRKATEKGQKRRPEKSGITERAATHLHNNENERDVRAVQINGANWGLRKSVGTGTEKALKAGSVAFAEVKRPPPSAKSLGNV